MRGSDTEPYDVITFGESMVVLSPLFGGALEQASVMRTGVGGAEGNVGIGLARLGHRVRWLSRVGDDGFGRMILSTLRGQGVDVSAVRVDADHPTGIYFKERLPNGKTRATYYRRGSAASFLSPQDVEEGVSAARYLVVTGISPALSSTAQAATERMIQWAQDRGTTIVLDPNIRFKLWPSIAEARQYLKSLSEKAEIIVPGLEEGRLITGLSDPADIASWFLNRGRTKIVVIKLGRNGAYYASLEENGRVSGYPVEQVDDVGAGDAFVAGVVSGILDDLPLRDAVDRACAMGAIAVTAAGDYEALPTRQDLTAFIDAMTGRTTEGER